MYRHLLKSIALTNKFQNTLINNYATKSAGILRGRYYKRKPDNTRYEYNESITVIPKEFEDQDEYIAEKEISQKFEEKHQILKQRRLNSIGVQLPKKNDSKCQHEEVIIKKHVDNDDLPVSNMKDPYEKPIHQCIFCKYEIDLDYKNVQLLSQFISPITGLLYRQEIVGLCWPKYQELEKTVKKARDAGLMPYFYKNKVFVNDPRLIDGFKNRLEDIPNDYSNLNNEKN